MTPQMTIPPVLNKMPWYAQTWFTIITLIFFAPIGWFLMWKYRKWGVGIKLIATVVSLIIFISAMNDKSKVSPPNSNTVTSGASTPSVPAVTEPVAKEAPSPPDATISATALGSAYNANQVAADGKYKDKDLLISGTISSIGVDIAGTSYVTLKSEEIALGVQCMFDDKYKSRLAELHKGDRVNIRGTCQGNTLGIDVMIADSSLQ